jgi:hypothetical protein
MTPKMRRETSRVSFLMCPFCVRRSLTRVTTEARLTPQLRGTTSRRACLGRRSRARRARGPAVPRRARTPPQAALERSSSTCRTSSRRADVVQPDPVTHIAAKLSP